MSAPEEVYHGNARPAFMQFASRRSTVHSTKGIVACSQPLASRCGIKILEQGGNAADAAVATCAALNIMEPCMNGIGGDMFCLFYNAKTRKTHAMNGSGRSAMNYTLEQLRKDIGLQPGQNGEVPFTGVQAVTVPGVPAGLVDTVEKFGSGKLSLEQILTPAIELAEHGFPVHELASVLWQNSENLIKRASPNGAEMLKKDEKATGGCRAPLPGELFKNPTLANTFKLLAKHGKEGFYEGQVADALIKVVQDLGGKLTHEDLQNHMKVGSEEVDAISFKFSGQGIKDPVELWEHPPNGQGLVALLALGILQEMEKAGTIKKFDVKDHNSLEYLHPLLEALRLAFTDGTWFISDPSVVKVPVAELLSPSYLASRAKLYSPDKAQDNLRHGNPLAHSSNTAYFSTSDPEGNACSFIVSNYAGFGTGIIPAGCGFTLQNRGANFVLQPQSHPNVYAPGKRPYHTIIPGMVTYAEDQTLHSCFGVMGGFMQPQGHIQVLFNQLIFGMTPQEALDAPRVCVEAGSGTPNWDGDVDNETMTDKVFVEEGISEEVVEGLKRLGHRVVVLGGHQRQKFGRGQVIRRTVQEGQLVWSGGSDLRADGHAAPL